MTHQLTRRCDLRIKSIWWRNLEGNPCCLLLSIRLCMWSLCRCWSSNPLLPEIIWTEGGTIYAKNRDFQIARLPSCIWFPITKSMDLSTEENLSYYCPTYHRWTSRPSVEPKGNRCIFFFARRFQKNIVKLSLRWWSFEIAWVQLLLKAFWITLW